ncbi:MAG TPA: hypothetical protein VFW11_15265 [Cyclobacteriaceae bacterium]|nr:hypothetical protein [Cyclobacteriaceae bacterium]
MNSLRNYINIRTFVILLLSQLSCYVAIKFNFKLRFDFVLFGLAIAFPLGFSIQSAFKRREKALEYLSLFKAGLLAIHYSFRLSAKLGGHQKHNARSILTEISDRLSLQLRSFDGNMKNMQDQFDKIFAFVEENREDISGRVVIRVVRYMEHVAEGTGYLLSLVQHRTMAGLRLYAIIFITFFVMLHGPLLFYRFEHALPLWVVYATGALSSLLLITLYNFQQLIEYPFNQKGSDYIKLDEFKLNI